jgi:hypothetical protein
MITRPDLKFGWIEETIRDHFDFLFNRGFSLTSTLFTDQGTESWQAVMLLNDCFIRIRCDHGKIDLSLSSSQLYDLAYFFDLNMLAQPFYKRHEPHDIPDTEWLNEEKQIREIAGLLREQYDDIFKRFKILESQVQDRSKLNSELNENGQLSMDNCPFFIYVARDATEFTTRLLRHRSHHHQLAEELRVRLALQAAVDPVRRAAGSRHGMPVAPVHSPPGSD